MLNVIGFAISVSMNVFSDVIFYPRVLQYFRVSKAILALAYLVALTI